MKNRGFTLIELLAGMALTTLLMLAIFQVLASVARQGRAMEAAEEIEPWQVDLVNAIRWDLINADSVSTQGDRVEIKGHGAIDRNTMSSRHEPVDVAYFVRRVGSRNWLIRREKSSDSQEWTAMVCPDVERFEINSSEPDQAEGLSPRYMLRVQCAGGKAIDEILVLR